MIFWIRIIKFSGLYRNSIILWQIGLSGFKYQTINNKFSLIENKLNSNCCFVLNVNDSILIDNALIFLIDLYSNDNKLNSKKFVLLSNTAVVFEKSIFNRLISGKLSQTTIKTKCKPIFIKFYKKLFAILFLRAWTKHHK